jgi:nucleoid-associated protein YgaU
MAKGGLAKMKITAFEDPKYQKKMADGEFTVLINPDGYSYSYKIEYKGKQAPGTKGAQPKFTAVEPEQVEFEFLFDKSGAIPGTLPTDQATRDREREKGVVPDLEKFKKVVYDYKGKTHRPPFLQLTWGTLLFKGVLIEMNWTYKMFSPDGTPLRASVKAKFKGNVENDLRVKQQNDQSPDITHVRIVKAGDTLPQLAYEIYEDPSYYIKVAAANKLINFRNLQPGQKIFFPPIKKE